MVVLKTSGVVSGSSLVVIEALAVVVGAFSVVAFVEVTALSMMVVSATFEVVGAASKQVCYQKVCSFLFNVSL